MKKNTWTFKIIGIRITIQIIYDMKPPETKPNKPEKPKRKPRKDRTR